MAVLLVREAVVAVRLTDQPLLSVVVPTLNEGEAVQIFFQSLRPILSAGNEIIVVDGGSETHSLQFLKDSLVKGDISKLFFGAKGRAHQMNMGAEIAKGKFLLFLHADTYLPASAYTELQGFFSSSFDWGRFNVQLDNPGWSFRVISWFINQRSRLSSIATGDQAIFVRRELFEKIGAYAELPLMEDVDLSIRLKKISKPLCLCSKVITSARKWEKNGVIRTVWLMWRLRASYALGGSPDILADQYYAEAKKRK